MENRDEKFQIGDTVASTHSVVKMQLPKGHKEILQKIIDLWELQGIKNVPSVHNGYPLLDCDNVIIYYTDVANLVEVVREYAYKVGVEDGFNQKGGE